MSSSMFLFCTVSFCSVRFCSVRSPYNIWQVVSVAVVSCKLCDFGASAWKPRVWSLPRVPDGRRGLLHTRENTGECVAPRAHLLSCWIVPTSVALQCLQEVYKYVDSFIVQHVIGLGWKAKFCARNFSKRVLKLFMCEPCGNYACAKCLC